MPNKRSDSETDLRLTELVERMPMQVWQITEDNTYGYLNKAHADFIGTKQRDAIGVSVYRFLKKDDADRCIASNKLVRRTKNEMTIDEWFMDARGENHLLHITKSPQLDKAENVLFITCIAEDITGQHNLNELKTKKEHILNAIADFSRELFSERSDAIARGLSILGNAVDVDRVYYWKNHFDSEHNQWLTSQMFEWCSDDIEAQIDNTELQNLPLEEVSDFIEPLKKNMPFNAHVADLAESPSKTTLEAQQIQSILVLPMFFNDVFAGFVGFDSCRCRREWSDDEIFLLRMFIDLLVKALHKKQLQDEIEQSRQNFNNFFEMIDDMLFILDGNARIKHVNQAFVKKTGFEAGELLGESILKLHPPYRHEEARSLIFSMLSGTCRSCQIPLLTKSGVEIPVSIHVYNGQWNGAPAHFGIAQDVSLLQFSEQKFFKAFDDSFLLKAIVNASDGSIIDANKALCSALGYEVTDILGKTPSELKMLTSEKDLKTVREAFRTKTSIEDAEVTIYKKDKTTSTVLMNASPIEVGQLSCFIVSMLDITERKRMENEIREYNEHLESLVRQKVHEISDALWGTITALVHLAELRDGITGAHIKRLAAISRIVSTQLAAKGLYQDVLNTEFIDDLEKAITLHDIGKVGIRDSILLKKGKLTPEEFEEMKAHTTIGAQTLREAYQYYPGNGIIKMAIDVAASHHERWDGKGYPAALAGEEIPLSAQISAICDVYDAIRSKRSYKEAMSHAESLDELKMERGTHFNPAVSDAFMDCEKEIEEFYKQYPL